MTGREVADYDWSVWEGTDLEDADCEVTIEWIVCERAVCHDEGLIAGLFGSLPSVWKQIFNLWGTLETPMMLPLQKRSVGQTVWWTVLESSVLCSFKKFFQKDENVLCFFMEFFQEDGKVHI